MRIGNLLCRYHETPASHPTDEVSTIANNLVFSVVATIEHSGIRLFPYEQVVGKDPIDNHVPFSKSLFATHKQDGTVTFIVITFCTSWCVNIGGTAFGTSVY